MAGALILSNPAGINGLPTTFDILTDERVSAETTTTISSGLLCSQNTTGGILKATTVVSEQLCLGFALYDILAGANGLVVVRGIVKNALSQGGNAAGDQLIRSATVAGAVLTKVAATTDIGGFVGVGIVTIADTATGLVYAQKY